MNSSRITGLVLVLLPLVVIIAADRAVFAEQTVKVDDTLTVIHRRKSVRKYLDKPVTKEQLTVLMKAGMAAPTAADKRPWAFVAVTDRALLDSLSECSPTGKMLKQAAAAIVVCGDTKRALNSEVWVQDCSAASENILLAAEATRLGAVWIGIYPEYFKYNHVRRVLNIPMEVIPLNIISIGWPTGEEKPKEKFDPSNIHWQTW
jgi:nitroreductase